MVARHICMATWFSVIRVPAIASVRHTLQWVKDIQHPTGHQDRDRVSTVQGVRLRWCDSTKQTDAILGRETNALC